VFAREPRRAEAEVVPLGVTLGSAAGHRLVLLSLERWPDWADLRFARLEDGGPPLARRVPAASAWRVEADGRALEVVEVVGRGDRAFSNGEARLVPAPHDASELSVTVELAPGAVVSGCVRIPGRSNDGGS
jgi:hypothetical protein